MTGQLSSTDWASSDGKDTLSFTGSTSTETSGGEKKQHIYALSKVDKASVGNAGSSITAVMLLEDGSTIVVTLASASSQDPSSWTVHSSDFADPGGATKRLQDRLARGTHAQASSAWRHAGPFGEEARAKTVAAVEAWAQSNCPHRREGGVGRQATVDWGAGEVIRRLPSTT